MFSKKSNLDTLNHFFCLLLVFLSINEVKGQAPIISSFSPQSGAIGNTITILGNNFSSDTSKNIVYFGATQAKVVACSNSIIKVIVPMGATYSVISVLNLESYLICFSKAYFSPVIVPINNNISKNDFVNRYHFANNYAGNHYQVSGDINGDGRPDFAWVSEFSDTIMLRLNKTNINGFYLDTPIFIQNNSKCRSIDLNDINGDGKLDLIIGSWENDSISIFINQSNGVSLYYLQAKRFKMGFKSKKIYDISSFDLDSDGRIDVVATSYPDSSILIIRNIGNKDTVKFANPIKYATLKQPVESLIADIDGDSKPDIISLSYAKDSISVYRNICKVNEINFEKPLSFLIGPSGPVSMRVVDINNDTKLDIVAVNSKTNNLSILLNSSDIGNVSFLNKNSFETHSNPSRINIADMDGDFKPDIIVSDSQTTIYKNNSINNLLSFTQKIFIDSIFVISIVDVDLDGRLDFIGDGAVAKYIPANKNGIEIVASLTEFNSCFGKVSSPQSFTIAGDSLISDIFIKAPKGIELSLYSIVGYDSVVRINHTLGKVQKMNVYVRLSGTDLDSLKKNVVFTTAGYDSILIPLSARLSYPIANNSITGANQSLCVGSNSSLIRASVPSGGDGYLYFYKWIKSTFNSTNGFTVINESNFQNLPPQIMNSTTWYKRIIKSGACTDDTSNVYNITVNSKPTSSAIQGQINVGTSKKYSYLVTPNANYTYNWEVLNGNILSGQGTNTIDVKWSEFVDGTIKLTIINLQNCSDTSILHVNISNTSLSEIQNKSYIEIYPNPIYDKVNIVNNSNLNELEYSLTDLVGSVLITNFLKDKNSIIDLTNLSKGIYLLNISNSKSFKIVKY